jgi:2-methylcitrate dehydratase PrpD
MSEQITDLCRHIAALSLKTVPDAVLDHARLVLLDSLGVITAGARSPHIDRIAKHLESNANRRTAIPCLGRREFLNSIDAAQLMGMAGSSLEFEEGNSRAMGHPAIQIIPALIAESVSRHHTGTDFLLAFISGYEVACRVSRAANTRRGLHPTGTWGVVGSGVGVGKLRRLEAKALSKIMNIVAGFAFSPFVKNSFTGHSVACSFAGMVNHIGLWANTLFEKGIEADPGSFHATYSQFVSERFNYDVLTDGLGKHFAISENYIKPYPTCRFTQPALDAIKVLQEHHDIDPARIDQITVHSFKAAVHGSSERPPNVEALRFSLPYQIAIQLVHGKVDLSTLSENHLQGKSVSDIARKIKLVFAPDLEQLRPARNLARVTIRLIDGSEHSHEIDNCLGDPGKPLSRDQIYEKFINLTKPVVGRVEAEQAAVMIETIEKQESVNPIVDLLKVTPHGQ